MPHATEPEGFDDDALIEQVLDPGNQIDFNRELEPGEKADNAINYEDISDDDLADDEDPEDGHGSSIQTLQQENSFSIDFDDDVSGLAYREGQEDESFADLFGDEPSSPTIVEDATKRVQAVLDDTDDLFELDDAEPAAIGPEFGPVPHYPLSQKASNPLITTPVILNSQERKQQELFALSRHGIGNADHVPAPPENQEELLASMWPKFQRNTVPKFMDLLPPKRARYIGKVIPKKPKPVNPTRIILDLAPDQEKGFRLLSTSNKRANEDSESSGVISIELDTGAEEKVEEVIDTESDFENEIVGGASWQDLQVACADWETGSSAGSNSGESEGAKIKKQWTDSGLVKYDGIAWPCAKRRKLEHATNLLQAHQFTFPSLHSPEHATAKIAQKVTLDLNDSQLLIDHVQSNIKSRGVFGGLAHEKAGRTVFAKGLSYRYNISNDEAYDLLKENHQNKVRSMLGNLAVEHSLPAVRLQWPFYKTKLDKQDARAFHRPIFSVNRNEHVIFGKHHTVKRKHLKGKATQGQFQDSKDLSMADNSSVLLLEYSEEYPTMISNVGMGNRIVNYYRRKTAEDTSRPKLDIGETAVLLPQDKSPFSIFGHVDPGQTIPAVYNGMYRAPIFKQAAKDTDFLVVKQSTGVHGSTWFLRNTENVYAVGQEFPAVDVPGPHSRKVTTASKNRLKMISYRLIRKNKSHRISVGEVTSHFADSSDMQNRQKMKEFMQFNKEHKEWQMRPGESVPDEDSIRAMVKPEDVCLLESMQVGQQHLQDAGFSKGDDDSEEDDAKEGQNIEQQLAPWYTSRNFLNATQGKAMLTIHGEGDPTGRGEAFSFIKTSMKGGFRSEGASANEKMQKKQMKDSSGHAYNVQEQQRQYEESIRRIWDAQKRGLSATVDQPDSDFDEDPLEKVSNNTVGAGTPRSEAPTPATMRRRDDETASQFTQHSSASQSGKTLRIIRNIRDEYGELRQIVDIIRDPKVIRQYLKRRHEEDEGTEEYNFRKTCNSRANECSVRDMRPTDDPEKNKRMQKKYSLAWCLLHGAELTGTQDGKRTNSSSTK